MSDAIASERYTRALFEQAQKENCLTEVEARLWDLIRILEAEPRILQLMANPTLTEREKCDLALKLLANNPSGLLERFLRVLIDKKRFALLPEVQKLFHAYFEESRGIQEVEVTSAVPFSASFQEKLKNILKKKLCSNLPSRAMGRTHPAMEIRLIPVTDRGLLGGFVLRFSGKEIDCSFKNRLHEIHQKLFSSFQEGIA